MLNSDVDISNKTERIATSLNLGAIFQLLLKINEKVDTGHWSCQKENPFSRWFFYMIKELAQKTSLVNQMNTLQYKVPCIISTKERKTIARI